MDKVSQGTTMEEGALFLDGLYDVTTQNGGQALQFRIFDVQLSGSLTEEWLKGALTDQGTSADAADWMIRQGLLRVWTNSCGERGYTLYTPYQAEVLTKLRRSGRYDLEELRHVMNDWDDYLEAIIMEEPAYDDESVPDYKHFVRRAHEMLELFSEDDAVERPDFISGEQWERQKAESRQKADAWRKVCQIVDSRTGGSAFAAAPRFIRPAAISPAMVGRVHPDHHGEALRSRDRPGV